MSACATRRPLFRLIDAFEKRIGRLSEQPMTGRERDELAPGLRSVLQGTYLILYRPLADEIELVRVVHGARRLERLADLD